MSTSATSSIKAPSAAKPATAAASSSSTALVPAGGAAAPTPAASSRLPGANTLTHAFRYGLQEDKPIIGDYWMDARAFIGKNASGEQMLVKSREEYTSTIVKIMKCESDLIVATENSIYIVDAAIPVKRVALQSDSAAAAPASAGAAVPATARR